MCPDAARAEGLHCTMQIERATSSVLLVTIAGFDVGELGDWPFSTLAPEIHGPRPIDLFIDARSVRGASLVASSAWAVWLVRHRERLRSVTMLACARAVRMTATFVRRFAGLESRMRITDDEVVFDSILAFAKLPAR